LVIAGTEVPAYEKNAVVGPNFSSGNRLITNRVITNPSNHQSLDTIRDSWFPPRYYPIHIFRFTSEPVWHAP
jgi:hypothetical protein